MLLRLRTRNSLNLKNFIFIKIRLLEETKRNIRHSWWMHDYDKRRPTNAKNVIAALKNSKLAHDSNDSKELTLVSFHSPRFSCGYMSKKGHKFIWKRTVVIRRGRAGKGSFGNGVGNPSFLRAVTQLYTSHMWQGLPKIIPMVNFAFTLTARELLTLMGKTYISLPG